MAKPVPDHLYVATDGVLFKIGISHNPAGRMQQIGARLVKAYYRPYARAMEDCVKGILEHVRAPKGNEWFEITEAEMLETVRKTVRVWDDAEAIKRGVEPSRRPGPGEPLYQPPFALHWLETA